MGQPQHEETEITRNMNKLDRRLRAFVVAPHVQDDVYRRGLPHHLVERDPRVLTAFDVRSDVVERTDSGPRGPVDPDPDQLPLGVGHLLRALADEGQRALPWNQPAEVGGEQLAEGDADAAREVVGRVDGPITEIDHPLPGRDPLRQLPTVDRLGGG